MDGELVSGLLSENGDGGGNPTEPNLTYKEIFEKQCPYYMKMGMTADEFWNGAVELVVYYRKAYRLKKKEENFNAWLQGRYIYDALCSASPLFRSFGKGKIKPHEYNERPYDLFEEDRIKTEEEKAKKHQEDMKKKMQEWAMKVNKKFKK